MTLLKLKYPKQILKVKISQVQTQTQKYTRQMYKLKYSTKNLFIDETKLIWTFLVWLFFFSVLFSC